MDKISLHDLLRIYVPGLLLTIVLFFLWTGSLEDVGIAIIPAIFISLLFNLAFENLTIRFFNKIDGDFAIRFDGLTAPYEEHWKRIVHHRLLRESTIRYENQQQLDQLLQPVLASQVLSTMNGSHVQDYFSTPRSFGLMYFNCFMACVIGLVGLLCKCAYSHYYTASVPVHVILATVGLCAALPLFYFGAKRVLKSSLRRELIFWKTLPFDQFSVIERIANTHKDLTSDRPQM